MRIRSVLFVIVIGLIAAFAALNWNAFNTPTTLSLGVTEIQAPLGVVMLGVVAGLSVLFLLFILYLQSSVLLEARRHARELQANRELADQAEASRFTGLRVFLDGQLAQLNARHTTVEAALLLRLDQVERSLQTSIDETGNSLAAAIGELEDRVERHEPQEPRGSQPTRLA